MVSKSLADFVHTNICLQDRWYTLRDSSSSYTLNSSADISITLEDERPNATLRLKVVAGDTEKEYKIPKGRNQTIHQNLGSEERM